jgi:hypothetical protein
MSWIATHDKEIVALGTIFIALFTIVLAIATAFLYFATKHLVEGADKNAAKQLRAYVLIASGEVILDNPGGRISASILLKNFGQTPGYQFKTWTSIRIRPTSEAAFGDIGAWKQASIIGPSAEMRAPSDFSPITPTQVEEIIARRQSVFVSGQASFVDAFGKAWTFSFLDAAAGALQDLGGGRVGWGISPRGYAEIESEVKQ